MNDYFDLLANEFAAQSGQIKQFVKSHGPSIGAVHEILLRSFLKKYLPRWVSIGHGFVVNHKGALSKQCDILIYNSTYYSPLYQIEDFLVLAPESVIAVIEVKTVLTKKMLHDAIENLASVKTISDEIDSSLFIYRPPSLKATCGYIESFGFNKMNDEFIPDRIYGLSKYVLERINFVNEPEGTEGIGFLSSIGESEGFVFEQFFYDLYRKIETKINEGIKKGIDNIWVISGDSIDTHGRLRYYSAKMKEHGLVAKAKVKPYKAPPSA